MHPKTIGYLAAAVIMIPLTIWAKNTFDGKVVFFGFLAIVAIACIAWRIRFGHWPGDEFR